MEIIKKYIPLGDLTQEEVDKMVDFFLSCGMSEKTMLHLARSKGLFDLNPLYEEVKESKRNERKSVNVR